MKKVFFSVLMISAMFVLASCGSKSNSGEAAAEATEEESVAKVEFTDPAITFQDGIDLTSYFSPESVTQPIRIEDNGHNRISFNVKMKLIKKFENFKGDYPEIRFVAQLCDENESPLAEAYTDDSKLAKFEKAEVGKVFSFNFHTDNYYGDNMFESEMDEVIKKIRKVTIEQTSFDLYYVDDSEKTNNE